MTEEQARAVLEPLERVHFWICDGVVYELTHPGVLEDQASMCRRLGIDLTW